MLAAASILCSKLAMLSLSLQLNAGAGRAGRDCYDSPPSEQRARQGCQCIPGNQVGLICIALKLAWRVLLPLCSIQYQQRVQLALLLCRNIDSRCQKLASLGYWEELAHNTKVKTRMALSTFQLFFN